MTNGEIAQLDMLTELAGTRAPKLDEESWCRLGVDPASKNFVLLAKRVNREITLEEHARGMVGNGVQYVDRYNGRKYTIYPYPGTYVWDSTPGFYDDPGTKEDFLPWKNQLKWFEDALKRQEEWGRRIDALDREPIKTNIEHYKGKVARAKEAIENKEPDPRPPFEDEYNRCRMIYMEEVKKRTTCDMGGHMHTWGAAPKDGEKCKCGGDKWK